MTEQVGIVKVAKLGERPVEVATSDGMTVAQVIESAGYGGFEGTIHARAPDSEESFTVSKSDAINGYNILVLSTNVKGGRN